MLLLEEVVAQPHAVAEVIPRRRATHQKRSSFFLQGVFDECWGPESPIQGVASKGVPYIWLKMTIEMRDML